MWNREKRKERGRADCVKLAWGSGTPWTSSHTVGKLPRGRVKPKESEKACLGKRRQGKVTLLLGDSEQWEDLQRDLAAALPSAVLGWGHWKGRVHYLMEGMIIPPIPGVA